MKTTRRIAGCITWAALVLHVAACGSTAPQTEQGGPGRDLPDAATAASGAKRTRVLAARHVGPVEFRAYDGAAAGDPRLPAAVDRLAEVVLPTLVAAEDRAGVTLQPSRDAVVMLIDVAPHDATGGTVGGTVGARRGNVNLRLVRGVRRPVIRISARALLAGEFVPAAHFPPLLVEAAVVASAGDRVAPAWLRSGLGPEITGTFERLLHERALGGGAVITAPELLFPSTPAGDDPLWAAARVRALSRIARGERPLARFVAARLEGRSELAALQLVGVQDAAFLEAATETEMDRALAALLAGGPLEALGKAREALRQGDPSRAAAHVALLDRELGAGTLSPWVTADARLTIAQYALVAGDLRRARALASSALAAPEQLVRVREARLCEARAARASGDQSASAMLFRAYLADFPGAPGSDEALDSLGIDTELAARLPGIAGQLAAENPAERGRAAVRLGETGDAATAPPLRRLTADEDGDVRRLAYAALALVLGPDAADDLDAGTRDAHPEVRGAALAALAFVDTRRGETRARELAADDAAAVEVVVERILAPIREREARELEEARRARREREAREAREARKATQRRREETTAVPPPPPRAAAPPRSETGATAPPKPRRPTPRTGTRRGGRSAVPTRRVRDEPLPPPRPPRPLPARDRDDDA